MFHYHSVNTSSSQEKVLFRPQEVSKGSLLLAANYNNYGGTGEAIFYHRPLCEIRYQVSVYIGDACFGISHEYQPEWPTHTLTDPQLVAMTADCSST